VEGGGANTLEPSAVALALVLGLVQAQLVLVLVLVLVLAGGGTMSHTCLALRLLPALCRLPRRQRHRLIC